MSRGIPVNGRVLRQRIMELGISERVFAVNVGISSTVLRSILADGLLGNHLTVGTLYRILSESGLTTSDLLEQPCASLTETPTGDARRLAQVLVSDSRLHPRERLAGALEWTLSRVDDAVNDLHPRLQEVGLAVYSTQKGITLRPRDTDSADALRRLQQMFDVDEGLNTSQARILHRATLPISENSHIRTGDRPYIANLYRQGMLEVIDGQDGGRFRLSEAAAFALALAFQ